VALLAAQGRDHTVASVGLIEIVPYARASYSLFTSTTAIGFAVDDGGKRMSDGRVRYPCAIAPTINTTKLVATAIATFVSTDKFITLPSIVAATLRDRPF
jgi:hypothetical protein